MYRNIITKPWTKQSLRLLLLVYYILELYQIWRSDNQKEGWAGNINYFSRFEFENFEFFKKTGRFHAEKPRFGFLEGSSTRSKFSPAKTSQHRETFPTKIRRPKPISHIKSREVSTNSSKLSTCHHFRLPWLSAFPPPQLFNTLHTAGPKHQ